MSTTPPGPPDPWEQPEDPASGQVPPPPPPPPPGPPPSPTPGYPGAPVGGYQAPPSGYSAPPGGYPQGGYPQGYPPRNSGTAIAILVLGIAGLVFTCAYGFGVVAAIVALALSPKAKREIAASGGALTGEGMIRAGVICSWISVGLTVAGILIVIVFIIGGTMANAASV